MWGVTPHEMAKRLLFWKDSAVVAYGQHTLKMGLFHNCIDFVQEKRNTFKFPVIQTICEQSLHRELGGPGSMRDGCVPNHPPGWKTHPGLVLWPGKSWEERVSRWGRNAVQDWGGAVSWADLLCVIHPDTPSGQSRGLVCIGSRVMRAASYSPWEWAVMALAWTAAEKHGLRAKENGIRSSSQAHV